MKQTPLVSIIIPTYNRAHLIGETLDSVLAQTYTHWECIVVDDGSTDNTSELLQGYCNKDARFQYHQRPSNRLKGANACRNYGFELSKGEYVNWFDSDDLMFKSKLEKQIKLLHNSKLNFIVCQTLVFENNIKNIIGFRKDKIHSTDFFNDFVTNKIKWLTQAPLIKKKFLLEDNVCFDEDIHQSQERDFFVNVLSKVENYLFDDRPLVYFRKHEDSISNSNFDKIKLYSNFIVNYKIIENHFDFLSFSSIQYLKNCFKHNIRESVLNKNSSTTKRIKKLLFRNNKLFNYSEKLKLNMGVFLLRYTGKGYNLFK